MESEERAIQESPLSYKIILLGDSDIGKTCFIRQFIDNEFPAQTKPTISVDFVTKTYQVDEFSVRLNIFDTAGQERHRALTKAYFKGTDAVLFMYSMDSKQSFLNVANWVTYFEKESESRDELRVLVGTKKDLLSQGSGQNNPSLAEPAVTRDQIKELVETYHFVFKFETSARANLNINIVFEQLSRNLIYNSLKRKRSTNLIRQSEWSVILKRDRQHLLREEERRSGCC